MVLSQALINAAREGDLAAVQEWLDAGGDPDDTGSFEGRSRTLLHHVASAINPPHCYDPTDVSGRRHREQQARGHCAIVSALLARGATVDSVHCFDTGSGSKNTPLLVAAIYGRADIIRLLCQAGANVNYRRSPAPCGLVDFPLCLCFYCPAAVRELLRFGADPSMKCELGQYDGSSDEDDEDRYELILPEEEALRQADERRSDPPPAYRPDGPNDAPEGGFRESARLIRDARLLRPRIRGVFALRALCHRGRAAPTAETPAAFARLIGGGTSRPRTRAAAKVPSSPGLPDPLAHLVCKFWLGEPLRRRRAAPATE